MSKGEPQGNRLDQAGVSYMTDKRFNFTKAAINTLPVPTTGKRIYYRDTQIKGLALVAFSSGKKSFYLTKKIKGKTEKIHLGLYPDLAVESARNQAKLKLAQIANGINPNEELRSIRDEMTFGELFNQYMTRYSRVHKKSWQHDATDVPRFLSSLFHKKLPEVKRADMQYIHEIIYANNGLYQANRVLIRARAIYNKAIEWGWEGRNPTAGLKLYKEKSRDRFAQPYELPHLIRAIEEQQCETARDVFKMLLLTGARRTNTLMMRWEQIIWQQNVWKIPETKNGEPVIIPLSPRALEILKRRYSNANSEWVFPRGKDSLKHISTVKTRWKQTKARATIYYWQHEDERLANIIEALEPFLSNGISPIMIINKIIKLATDANIRIPNQLSDIRLHDLRRTFGSYQAISGASLQIIGKSLGHKSTQATQIYARLNLDAVRSSIETATDLMFAS